MELLKLDIEAIKRTVENYMCFDETNVALYILENLPADFRENPPKELLDLKYEIMSRIATASFYATSRGYELSAPEDSYKHFKRTLRGLLILKDVQLLNEQGLVPNILDLGPGEYASINMLLQEGCRVKYIPAYVNYPSYEKYRKFFKDVEIEKPDPNQPSIYVACEIIEHLHNKNEIRFEMHRYIGLADIIHASTPNCTFDKSCTDWRTKGDIGHLVAMTPNEFFSCLQNMFKEYKQAAYVSQILHSRMVYRNTKFKIQDQLVIDDIQK